MTLAVKAGDNTDNHNLPTLMGQDAKDGAA